MRSLVLSCLPSILLVKYAGLRRQALDARDLETQAPVGQDVVLVLKDGLTMCGTVIGFQATGLRLMGENGSILVPGDLVTTITVVNLSRSTTAGNNSGISPGNPPMADHPGIQEPTDDHVVPEWIKDQALFDAQTLAAELEPEPETFPRFNGDRVSTKGMEEVRAAWARIGRSCEDASKVTQKGGDTAQFQQTVQDLTALAADAHVYSPDLACFLGYAQWQLGDYHASLDNYGQAAFRSHNEHGYLGAAAAASKQDDSSRATLYLTMFFSRSPLQGNPGALFVLARLLSETGSLRPFRRVLDAVAARHMNQEWILATRLALHVLSGGNSGQSMAPGVLEKAFGELQCGSQLAWAKIIALANRDNVIDPAFEIPREWGVTERWEMKRRVGIDPERFGVVEKYAKRGDFGFIKYDLGERVPFTSHVVSDAPLLKILAGSVERPTARAKPICVQFELSNFSDKPKASNVRRVIDNHGYIANYVPLRQFGFVRNTAGEKEFFHLNRVSDIILKAVLLSLSDTTQDSGVENSIPFRSIPLVYELRLGRDKTDVEVFGVRGESEEIERLLVSWEELMQVAAAFVRKNERPRAIAIAKLVVLAWPEATRARDQLGEWQKEKLESHATEQEGSSTYERAKKAQLRDHDLEGAVQLFRQAIGTSDNVEDAVRDLATTLVQVGRSWEAAKELEAFRDRTGDQESLDSQLVSTYEGMKEYERALHCVRERLRVAEAGRVRDRWKLKLAQLLVETKQYDEAESVFRTLVDGDPKNPRLVRGLAICLARMRRFDDAYDLLKTWVRDQASIIEDVTLMTAIRQAQVTGELSWFEGTTATSLLNSELNVFSGIVRFVLERCKNNPVSSQPIESGRFSPSDLEQLEHLATHLDTRRLHDRAEVYAAAARISLILQQVDNSDASELRDSQRTYRYLTRSLLYLGDAAVRQNLPLDVVREYYVESLSMEDGVKSVEWAGTNSLFRYFLSFLGMDRLNRALATSATRTDIGQIADVLQECARSCSKPKELFQGLAYMIWRSRSAARTILSPVYESPALREASILFLSQDPKGLPQGAVDLDKNSFARMWDQYAEQTFGDIERGASNMLRSLCLVEFTASQLEDGMANLSQLLLGPLFETDRRRASRLRESITLALDLLRQSDFEERERVCLELINQCGGQISEIGHAPTRLSLEYLRPAYERIQDCAKTFLKQLRQRSLPQIALRLAVESCPVDSSGCALVQIAIQNRQDCAPADQLQLSVKTDPGTQPLEVQQEAPRLDSALLGGEQKILEMSVKLTPEAVERQVFSLPLCAMFTSRTGPKMCTDVTSLSVKLYEVKDFERIDNPYAPFAAGSVVQDPHMFFGRDQLINSIADKISNSLGQSKSVVIFGPKRAGKSSILFHLRKKLQGDPRLLVLDLGNIARLLGPSEEASLFDTILGTILHDLQREINRRVAQGMPRLTITFPEDLEHFLGYRNPLGTFNEILSDFRITTERTSGWENVKVVLLIDEFSYIYGEILKQRLPESFMETWKALLQEGYFSAVLVGQDYMPRFKARFANEFGTTEDARITYLLREDARELVDLPIRIGGEAGESRYREHAIDRILELTAGSPFYTQIFCSQLVEYMNRQRARFVTELDIERVEDELLTGFKPLEEEVFDGLLDSGDTSADSIRKSEALSVLRQVARGPQDDGCTRANIRLDDRSRTEVVLEDLVRRDVLEDLVREDVKNHNQKHCYRIRVGLFRDWLNMHR